MVCKFDANIWNVIHFDFDNFIIHINKNVLAVHTVLPNITSQWSAHRQRAGFNIKMHNRIPIAVAIRHSLCIVSFCSSVRSLARPAHPFAATVLCTLCMCNMVDSYSTVAVHKLENEMHSIDTIAKLLLILFVTINESNQIISQIDRSQFESTRLHIRYTGRRIPFMCTDQTAGRWRSNQRKIIHSMSNNFRKAHKRNHFVKHPQTWRGECAVVLIFACCKVLSGMRMGNRWKIAFISFHMENAFHFCTSILVR